MELMRQFAGAAVTLALLSAAIWLLRRNGHARWSRSAGRLTEVIESRGLAPGHTLHVVRVGERVMALATHSGGCTLLDTLPWAEIRQAIQPEVRS
jgi:flagellar biogenesis protein FliO